MANTPGFGLPYPACPDCQPCPSCPGGLDAFENLAVATDTALAGVSAAAAAAQATANANAALIASTRLIFARKTADETVNNSAVMQNDDQLFVALPIGNFRIILDLVWNSGATPDIKFQWTTPAGVSGVWTVTATSGAALFLGSLGWASPGNLDGTGADLFSRFEGVIVCPNAGTLQFQWAQNTANASNTIVRANSLLIAQPLV